ncbi:unnamed protein product, partial [Prorocentrum cordatum]
ADGCFGRIDNRDPTTLVNLGHTELDIRMNWTKSTSSNLMLYNRVDDKKKEIYVPTVFQGGFTRTDFALMSFDISHPEVAAKAPREYDKIRDGAENDVRDIVLPLSLGIVPSLIPWPGIDDEHHSANVAESSGRRRSDVVPGPRGRRLPPEGGPERTPNAQLCRHAPDRISDSQVVAQQYADEGTGTNYPDSAEGG